MSERVDEVVARLRKGIMKSKEIFESVDSATWDLVVYEDPYPWTVRDLLAHFLSAEEGLLLLTQDIAAGGDGAPEGFDYQVFNTNEQQRLAAVPRGKLFLDLMAARRRTIAWVQGLEEATLDRVGRHPALGGISVETFINAIYGHQLMHMRDLKQVLE